MKMAPGSRSVPHRHAATELLQVLEGEVMDVDGQVFRAGDSLVYAAGSEHWLRSPRGVCCWWWSPNRRRSAIERQPGRRRVFCLRMYRLTNTALVSMKARAQNRGTR